MVAGQMSPADHALAVASWVQDSPIPPPISEHRLVLVLETLRGLSAVRRQVQHFLTASCVANTGDGCDDAVDSAVQVIDELTSNAIRHGLPPSALYIWDEPERWLIIVRDAAPQRLPAPAIDRPAGAGGYGLYLIADLTADHGVHYEYNHKLVWASLRKPMS